MRTAVVASVFCALAFVATGCEVTIGDKSQTIDPRKAEKLLTDHFAKQDAVVQKASCPDGVKIAKDAKFICTVTAANGDKLEVEFTQTDATGNVTVTKSDTMLVTKVLLKPFRDYAAKHPATKDLTIGDIRCPPDHKPKTGNTFECELDASNKETLLMLVTETDDVGKVNFDFHGLLYAPERLAKKLESELLAKKIKAAVNCGDKPLKLIAKMAVECQATDDNGKTALIRAVPTDAFGAFDWNIP